MKKKELEGTFEDRVRKYNEWYREQKRLEREFYYGKPAVENWPK